MLHPDLLALEQRFCVSPLQRIDDELFRKAGIEVWIKRDDLIHPVISGNKWRKLKYCLNHAFQSQADTLVSMGGPWSNHLHALACVGKEVGLKTRGYIRGEEPENPSPTLRDIRAWGMQLEFVSRQQFRKLRQYRKFNSLPGLKTGEYWIPEGGASNLALQGIHEIVIEITIQYDHLLVAAGTGTTLAGLIAASPENVTVWGIAALKGEGFLFDDVKQLLPEGSSKNWQIELNYHCGGFARSSPELRQFIQQFEACHQIPLDPVYNGKMFYALSGC